MGVTLPEDTAATSVAATDGGIHDEKRADATDTSLSTVYWMLQRLAVVVTSDYGHVQIVSETFRQEVRGSSSPSRTKSTTAADRAARIVDMDVR